MGWQLVFQTERKKCRMWAVKGLWGGDGGGEGEGVLLWSVEGLLVVEVEIQDFSGKGFGGGCGEEVVLLPCSSSGSGSLCCLWLVKQDLRP